MEMANLEERHQKLQVLDGGVSTEISCSHGHDYIDEDPLWSCRLLSTNPETIRSVHHSFLEAGSDIIGTVTYQASIDGFMKHFDISKMEAIELIKKGVQLAVEVRDQYWQTNQGKCVQQDMPLIAASLGPYGACLHDGSEYTGSYIDTTSSETLRNFHRPRIEAVIEGGADMIAFDTIPALEEAKIIANLMKEFTETSAWISFSCKDGCYINHGEPYAECADSLLGFDQIIGIGINCTSPRHVDSLLKNIPANVKEKKTVVLYPNSGEMWGSDKKWHLTEESPCLADLVPMWLECGAQWIGGCCRVTPADIQLIRTNMYNCEIKR